MRLGGEMHTNRPPTVRLEDMSQKKTLFAQPTMVPKDTCDTIMGLASCRSRQGEDYRSGMCAAL